MTWSLYLVAAGAMASLGALIWLLVRHVKAPPPPEGAAEALDLVMGFYGIAKENRPHLQFIRGADLNCREGRGFMEHGACVAGSMRIGPKVITLAWPVNQTFSKSALSHEATHFWLEIRGGAPDYEHKDPAFAPGGAASQLRDAIEVWEQERGNA